MLLKKLVSILLLSIYLLSTTQVSELFKLPKLFEHYSLHSLWEGNPSFFSFLAKHYTEDNSKDADYAEDMKLPFKSLDTGSNSITSFYPMVPAVKMVKRVKVNEPVQRPAYKSPLYSSHFLSNIWQPPKGC